MGCQGCGVSGMWVSGMWAVMSGMWGVRDVGGVGVRNVGGGVRDVGGVGVRDVGRDVGGGVRDVGGGGGDSWRLAASSETQLCDLLQQVFAVLHVVHWRGADAHSLQTALLLKKQQQNLGLLRTHSSQTSLF